METSQRKEGQTGSEGGKTVGAALQWANAAPISYTCVKFRTSPYKGGGVFFFFFSPLLHISMTNRFFFSTTP